MRRHCRQDCETKAGTAGKGHGIAPDELPSGGLDDTAFGYPELLSPPCRAYGCSHVFTALARVVSASNPSFRSVARVGANATTSPIFMPIPRPAAAVSRLA
jgi:hypothetical protein